MQTISYPAQKIIICIFYAGHDHVKCGVFTLADGREVNANIIIINLKKKKKKSWGF